MIITQVNEQFTRGTRAERIAVDVKKTGENFVWYETDTGLAFIMVSGAWESFPGSLATSSWPKYVVSTGDPLAPFASINEAIASAVSAGHGTSSPVVVLVHPGVYAEGPIGLPDGISVVGLTDVRDNQVAVSGGFVVSGNGTAGNTIDGLSVDGGIVLQGTEATTLYLRKVVSTNASGPGLLISNTNPGAFLEIADSAITSSSTTALLIEAGSVADLLMERSSVTASVGSSSMSLQAGLHRFVRSQIGGTVETAGNDEFFDTDVSAGTGAAFSLSGGNIDVRGGLISTLSGGLLATGTGTMSIRDFDTDGPTDAPAAITQVTLQTSRVHTTLFLVGGGPFVLSSDQMADLIIISAAFPPPTVTLPFSHDVPDGRRVTFRDESGNFTTINAAAGDTIRGGANIQLLTAPLFNVTVELQNVRAASDWRPVATSTL